MLGLKLRDAQPEIYKQWVEREQYRFFRDCKLTDSGIPEDLDIKPTRLYEFCQRWMNADKFKLHEESDEHWRPITPEQNALRVTMIRELVNIGKNNLTSA